MADEREGLLGIRWALAGGGQVTRIIKGYPDDLDGNGLWPFNDNVSNPNYQPDFYTLFGTTGSKSSTYLNAPGNNSKFTSGWNDDKNGKIYSGGEYKDTEYDIFSYSLPSGKSGKFILKDVNGSKTACLMPQEPVLIIVDNSLVKIIDENGISYLFGSKLNSNNQYIDGNSDGFPTTWHLSTIISANKSDTVFFEYKRSYLIPSAWDKSLSISFGLHDNSDYYDTYDIDPVSGGATHITSALYDMIGSRLTDPNLYFKRNDINNPVSNNAPYYINSIRFRGGGKLIGSVSFNYDPNNNVPKYLNGIQVKDEQNNIVRKIGFSLKANQNNKFKLLDRIEYQDINDPTKKEVYSFDYFDSSSVPACGELSKNSDWWGYYSSGGGWLQSQNFTLMLPLDNGDDHTVNQILYDGDKKTQLGSMKIGMLQKIHFPTGGTEEFEYEANQYGVDAYCGGLRIKTAKKTSESNNVELRRYEYSTAVLPSYLYPPASNKNIYTENEIDCFGSKDYELSIVDFPSNYYGWGRLYQQSFQNTFPSRYTDMHSNVVNYSKVTEFFENSSGVKLGKTEYNYNVILPTLEWFDQIGGSGPFVSSNNYSLGYVSPKYFWKGNKLSSKVVYDNTLTNKVKENIYEYTSFTKESVYDMPIFRYRLQLVRLAATFNTTDDKTKELLMIHPDECSDCLQKTFAIKHQEYTIGAEKLTKETENTYNSDGSKNTIIKETQYEPTNLMEISETITNSDGILTKNEYSYPFNTALTDEGDDEGNSIYKIMSQDQYHCLSPVIEKWITTLRPGNTTLVEKVTNKFSYNNWFYPSSVEYFNSGLTITYNNYTSQGLPQYLAKNNNAENVVFLWSYNQQYPIAEIKNATYDQVVTQLGGESKINEIANKLIPSSSDLDLVNNLRTLLPQALVNTYTYTSLLGRISATDPRGITTNFEYDGMGRLKDIYRMNGANKEIIKHYEYNYALQ